MRIHRSLIFCSTAANVSRGADSGMSVAPQNYRMPASERSPSARARSSDGSTRIPIRMICRDNVSSDNRTPPSTLATAVFPKMKDTPRSECSRRKNALIVDDPTCAKTSLSFDYCDRQPRDAAAAATSKANYAATNKKNARSCGHPSRSEIELPMSLR